jgi:thiamine biosynthesis lipoprotein
MSIKQSALIMGMPINIEITDDNAKQSLFKKVFDYFRLVDKTYSTYKEDSEISRINRGLPKQLWSNEMKLVLDLCQQTKRQTKGFFDIEHKGKLDPSGLVKGWAIKNAADIITAQGFRDFYIDVGGDIQVSGKNPTGQAWRVGIRNPFNKDEIIKTVAVTTQGVATSGSYIRGQHIYNPHTPNEPLNEIIALTVIGPDIYNADRFATAAYAMGMGAAKFIENLNGYEAYMVDHNKVATLTSGFESYVI